MLGDVRTWGMILRVLGAVAGAALCVWGVLPLATSRINSGTLTLMLAGAAVFAACVWFPAVAAVVRHWWQSTFGKTVLLVAAVVATVLITLFVVVSVNMVRANFKEPAPDATVVVLGAGLRGNRPSTILRGRLETAVDYLTTHPQAICVVSGGQGRDEVCTEASVMYTYLINAGIAPERLFVEERSTSTFENIAFSREIIEKNGLNSQIALITQEFHQYRAAQFAKAAGFTEVGAVTAHTPWYLLGSYWIRDFAGICHRALLGT